MILKKREGAGWLAIIQFVYMLLHLKIPKTTRNFSPKTFLTVPRASFFLIFYFLSRENFAAESCCWITVWCSSKFVYFTVYLSKEVVCWMDGKGYIKGQQWGAVNCCYFSTLMRNDETDNFVVIRLIDISFFAFIQFYTTYIYKYYVHHDWRYPVYVVRVVAVFYL